LQPPIAAAIIPSSHDTVNVIIDPSSGTVCKSLAPLESEEPETILIPSEFAASVIDPTTGQAMESRELIRNPATKTVWQRSATNKFDRLCDGRTGRVNGTNTMRFISVHAVHKGRTITYA
jgi:ethanolamine ammonia-lyase small subunit